MQFAYQFPERCDRIVLVSSGGLGPDVGLILRLATLPGSELFLSVTAPAARWLVDLAASAGQKLRIRAAADAEHYARAYTALADPESRAAFLGTLRGVVGTRGQLVDARDRLYLAGTHADTDRVGRAGRRAARRPRTRRPRGHPGQPARDLRRRRPPSPARRPRRGSSGSSMTSWNRPNRRCSRSSAGQSCCAQTETPSRPDRASTSRRLTGSASWTRYRSPCG